MIIQPHMRGYICTTAHPLGCAQHVSDQVQYVKKQLPIDHGPKKVLIIGASRGYGLASRIVSAFGAQARTIGVSWEGQAHRTGRPYSAGWYSTAAFERLAGADGLYAKTINGDAFSLETKGKTMELIAKDWQGGVDLVIYSVAAPRRTDPKTGITYHSVLKPIDEDLISKTIHVSKGVIENVYLERATPEEIASTVAVMGGQDWMLWIDMFLENNLLAPGAKTIAYSYIGPQITYPIYADGTIGRAKKHLLETSQILQNKLKAIAGQAHIVINKAVVTQASAAIPMIPLYLSLLYKVMKDRDMHEGCIEQIYRLYNGYLYSQAGPETDASGLIRLDDLEMAPDVQNAVCALWDQVNDDNIDQITDFQGYKQDFLQLFGFGFANIDYDQDCDINLSIPSLQ